MEFDTSLTLEDIFAPVQRVTYLFRQDDTEAVLNHWKLETW